jgi:hypothetical protein
MATLQIQLTSGVISGGRTFTVSDADVQTLINYLVAKYSNNTDGPVTPPTPAQALTRWISEFINGTVGQVQSRATQQLVAAVVPPAPLSFT